MKSPNELVDKNNLPRHIAVIMDGNGRWAKKQGAKRIFGHQNAVESVRQVVEAAGELQVGYLTLYAFSTENWSRPKPEVDALMNLMVSSIESETKKLHKNNVKLSAIGELNDLPRVVRKKLQGAIDYTSGNSGLNLILALSYSGRWELTEVMRKIAFEVKEGRLIPENINSELIKSHLNTSTIPDPELLIRTSGEKRISNFMLWQMAYTELFFSPVLWPDFRKEHFYEAVIDYQKRDRRFGSVKQEQVVTD